MAVIQRAPASGLDRATLLRLAKWALMLVALMWTLVYRASLEGSGAPEFLYVNF